MRFGKTLREAIIPKWRGQYVDYAKLKGLLRENAEDDSRWTEDDENKFCEEILNVQLEKVANFQQSTFKTLEKRANEAAEKLQDLAPSVDDNAKAKSDITTGRFKEIEGELEAIINETKDLKKYSNINYTAFLKIIKKHDRKRGSNYKIKPMVMNILRDRPFNSESAYAPLLNKLSVMFYAVRQQLDEAEPTPENSENEAQSSVQNGERYTAYKFWVHPDNLLEVKTLILRRLPNLVYSEQASRDLEGKADPTLNSLYFDNPEFSLYNQKVDRLVDAASLRIRWSGQLSTEPEVTLEKKIVHSNGTSEDKRISIKQKHIQPFIQGEYKMEKSVQKMERRGDPAPRVEEFKNNVEEIQSFILENDLQPVLRANYTRTAFQKPDDDKVRISIDTKLAFIREDCIDRDRPCRRPESWHRLDVDDGGMVYPFPNINQGEISRFPYSALEIKIKEDGSRRYPQWVEDMMASHLVHKAPRFSKFVHGVASLFEDQVNNLPFWLSEIETDIRKDPQAAFEEEEERKAKRAHNEQVVGSFLGTPMQGGSFKPAVSSPMAKSYIQERLAAEDRAGQSSEFNGHKKSKSQSQNTEEDGENGETSGGYGTMASVFPSFSFSRYAKSRRGENVQLPPGVQEPKSYIKNDGPLKIESKVWLANDRTFAKWQHIGVLMSGLGIALFTAAGQENTIAKVMGIVYTLLAGCIFAWGWWTHRTRSSMIRERSSGDFDFMAGPVVITIFAIVALVLNFYFKIQQQQESHSPDHSNSTVEFVDTELI